VIAGLVAGLLHLAGCGGGGSGDNGATAPQPPSPPSPPPPPPASIDVSVTPAAASVQTGGMQTFTATVTNTTNKAVTWQVNGITGGNTSVGTISTTGCLHGARDRAISSDSDGHGGCRWPTRLAPGRPR